MRESAAARLAAERAELEPGAHVACGRGDEVAHREDVLPHVGVELRLHSGLGVGVGVGLGLGVGLRVRVRVRVEG